MLTDKPIIKIQNVSCKFGDFLAVDDLSFEVRPSEIVALVGKTGAGKSTVLNLVMGSLRPTQGQVQVEGFDPASSSPELRGKIGVSFQNDRLLPWRTAIENVEIGMQILKVPPDKSAQQAADWLGRVKMETARDKYPHELSGGMRQRVSLARALVIDPAILLLDESFSQLDPVTSVELRKDVAALVRSVRKTCLFITHRIEDAIEMADRILVLAPPARIALELALDDQARRNPGSLREQIEKVMQ
ncbi:MAG: ABC transporter ATP-binding protein [Rhizobiales bacterium]|nr:ABC transporter ATP-binding protein [Hyphomicrobiales bacterium]